MERVLGSHWLRAVVNWLWLRVVIKEGVNKSNHPIQNLLLLVTEPRTRDHINKEGTAAPARSIYNQLNTNNQTIEITSMRTELKNAYWYFDDNSVHTRKFAATVQQCHISMTLHNGYNWTVWARAETLDSLLDWVLYRSIDYCFHMIYIVLFYRVRIVLLLWNSHVRHFP
jgi:hypothetical protein